MKLPYDRNSQKKYQENTANKYRSIKLCRRFISIPNIYQELNCTDYRRAIKIIKNFEHAGELKMLLEEFRRKILESMASFRHGPVYSQDMCKVGHVLITVKLGNFQVMQYR